jgi:hypothetical protein
VQPDGRPAYPINLSRKRYCRHREHLPAVKQSSMLKAVRVLISNMLRRGAPESQWSGRCCAVLIVLSVCLLTIRVTTRFCFSDASPRHSVGAASVVQMHPTPERCRQRLIKDATTWQRPRVCSAVQAAVSYACNAPSGPSLPGLLILESLYNRPPPLLRISSSL